jgi:membrane-associated phospholipid phosphatase
MIKKIIFILLIIPFGSIYCQNPDYKILKTLNEKEMPLWDKTMKGVSFSVFPAMSVTPIGIWCNGYLTKDKTMMRNGFKSAISIGFAVLVTTGLKRLVNRERPYEKYPGDIIRRDKADPYSFPSGHTTAAFATATALTLTYPKWYVAVPAYVYAGFVGYSRMRLGMHFPTDVLGGIIIGIGSGLLTWQLDRLVNKR